MKKFFLLASVLLIASGFVFAKTCKETLSGNDLLMYDKKEIKVPADCTSLELTLVHSGKGVKMAMGHNVVISETKYMNEIGANGIKAGLEKDYVDRSDKRVLAASKMIGGGETDTLTLDLSKLKKGGDYHFYCTFPGHLALMKGKFIY